MKKQISSTLRPVRVRVPATSANLGPGFDTLGLALRIHNFITLEAATGKNDEIRAMGEGASLIESVPCNENIALNAARRLLVEELEISPPPLRMTLENATPLARGLGSSSAARVGGLVAANLWARENFGCSVDRARLLSLAAHDEGHADNVAPAMLGGFVASAIAEDGEVFAARIPVEEFPRLAVFIPNEGLATKTAREILPRSVPLKDATFNIARACLLTSALISRNWELLREATRDRLHQDRRTALMPGYTDITAAALQAGAFGATLSGAGPCILAWVPDDATTVQKVVQAMETAASACSVDGAAKEVGVDLEGAIQAQIKC